MVEIGGKPILWHIIKVYSAGGVNEFVICCGYNGYVIKEFCIAYGDRVADIDVAASLGFHRAHGKYAPL